MITYVACDPSIEQLYNSRFADNENEQFKISAKFEESPVKFGIVLMGGDREPDCKISSFVENIYFRTRNGVNKKKYKSIEGLEKAVRNVAKKYGYTLERLIIEEGEPDRL